MAVLASLLSLAVKRVLFDPCLFMWDFILLTSVYALASNGKNKRLRFPVPEYLAGILTRLFPSFVFAGFSLAAFGISAFRLLYKRERSSYFGVE